MFCRRAWQRVGPLARRSFKPPCRDAPVRRMSLGVPGGPNNMTYVILCGGGLTAAVVYAYKTVSGDTERSEDRPANVGAAAKAPSAEHPPAEEPTPESVLSPMEAVAEPAAEDAAAVVSEMVEPAATEEAAPPVAAEAAVETPAEASSAASTESVPDLLTAVKVLAGSTVEIAAASVGEKSLVNSVQQIQEGAKGFDSTEEVEKPETIEATTHLEAETATVEVNEEESKSAETGAADEVTDAEEATPKGTAVAEEDEEAASSPEETAASSPEEATASVQTAGEVGESEVEDQAPNPDAVPREDVFSIEVSPEDASSVEEAPITAEASPVDDTASAVETSVEEVAAVNSGEEAAEAASTMSESAAVVDSTQLAAASAVSELEVLSAAEPESEAPVHEAKHCHSCHSASPAAEEVAPPTDVAEQLVREEAVDAAHEVKEVASMTKTTGTMMVTFQS